MNRFNAGKLSIAVALLAAIGIAGTAARATERVEKRGDFWYDADGRFVSARHVDPPADFPRAGTSWREKSAALGVELPPRPAFLEERHTLAKPARVDDREVLQLNKLIVKFTEDGPVRMRRGSFTRSGSPMPDVREILTRFPAVTVRRLHQTEEREFSTRTRTRESGSRDAGCPISTISTCSPSRRRAARTPPSRTNCSRSTAWRRPISRRRVSRRRKITLSWVDGWPIADDSTTQRTASRELRPWPRTIRRSATITVVCSGGWTATRRPLNS